MTIANGTAFSELVATATGGVPTSTTASITTQSAGSLFLILVSSYGAPSAVTDNKGNTYSIVGSAQQNTSDGEWLALYQCTNGVGGAGHKPVVTFSSTLNPVVFNLKEVTGAASASAVDANAQLFDSSSPFGASVTTATAHTMVVGYFNSNANGTGVNVTFTPGAGFTIDSSSTFTAADDGLEFGVATQVVTATGTYNPAFTVSSGGRGPAITVALKEGLSTVTGSGATTEASGDTAAGTGTVPNFGSGSAVEASGDSSAATGTIAQPQSADVATLSSKSVLSGSELFAIGDGGVAKSTTPVFILALFYGGSGTVAALASVSKATFRIAYATDGRRSGQGVGAGSGCPVWSDGTNWRTFYDNTVVAA